MVAKNAAALPVAGDNDVDVTTLSDDRLANLRAKRRQAADTHLQSGLADLKETETEARQDLPKQHGDATDLASLVQRGRTSRGMSPLTSDECDRLLARAPEVFKTLATGGDLDQLVEAGHLEPCDEPCTDDSASPFACAPVLEGDHAIDFYVRELQVPGTTSIPQLLEEYAADFPAVSLWVELVKQRRHIRYVGLTVDGHPSTRIGEDFSAAVGADTDKTRLTNFMCINAACKWRTFRVPALATRLLNVSTSPLSDMLASPSAPDDQCPDHAQCRPTAQPVTIYSAFVSAARRYQ